MTDEQMTLCEVAACMWEHVLNEIARDDQQWKDYVEGWGYASARMEVVQHAGELERDYRSVADEYNMCFDWDFVPEWMDRNLHFGEHGSINLSETRHIPQAP